MDAVTRAAILCAAGMIGHQVAGKATRDALFLSNFDVTALPRMLILAAVFSFLTAVFASRGLARLSPGRFVPTAFAVSAVLLLAEWGLVQVAPGPTAIVFYLHMAILGSILISVFWSLVNELFDPRSAKRRVSWVAGGGTLGGLLGGALAERVGSALAVELMLPILAAVHLFCAVMARSIARSAPAKRREADVEAPALQWGYRLLARESYLRNLAAVVILGTIAAALLDFVLKARATEAFSSSQELLRFFAIFYTATAFLTFVIQTSLARISLERLGLARTVSVQPLAVAGTALGALLLPGLLTTVIARATDAVLRSSLFRSGYELLFTPVPPKEKRATKTIIDVGSERLGDAIGGGLVMLSLLLLPGVTNGILTGAAVVLALAGFVVAGRLHGGYVRSLERSLVHQAVELDMSQLNDDTTRSTVMRTLSSLGISRDELLKSTDTTTNLIAAHAGNPTPAVAQPAPPRSRDPMVARFEDLRSGDPDRIRRALGDARPLAPPLVPLVISLLALDAVSGDAVQSLRTARTRITGQLVDALLDPGEEFAIRRRVPRILAEHDSPLAVQGLLKGLADRRFEVRYQCGRALSRIHSSHPDLPIPPEPVFETVRREVTVDKRVWQSRRLLERTEETDDSPFVDAGLRKRSSRSLEHLFTVLSLALPAQPLQVAYRGLHTDDENLRGTALEYLESILPDDVRRSLWPFLEDRRPSEHAVRPQTEVLDELLRSNQSIEINLTELRKKRGTT